MRKMIFGNQSESGAKTQPVLMTIFRTLKRRGYNPVPTVVDAMKTALRTGQLPPLPPLFQLSLAHRRNAAENFSIIRRLALNLIKQEMSLKRGVKGKRLLAGWDDNYFLKIISG